MADTVLVTGGMLFFLAAQYGTSEFFGTASLMALLPLIPAMVLIGGAGSTVFALTKVKGEKRGWSLQVMRAALLAPAVVVALGLGLVAVNQSPRHRLNYLCLGQAPQNLAQVHLTGYSTFLREEWLATFTTGPGDFEAMVTGMKLVPVDAFEMQKALAAGRIKDTHLFRGLPALAAAHVCKRTFNEGTEHERGTVYAAYDVATGTAVVARVFRE